jgi:ubiquinone/menaquinone biosynthesis C-methylase UbiE
VRELAGNRAAPARLDDAKVESKGQSDDNGYVAAGVRRPATCHSSGTVEMSALAERISRQSRRKKMRVLLPLVRAARSVLDVGAGRGDFLYEDLPAGWSGRIVALDKRSNYLDELTRRFPFVETLVQDATALPFGDGEFDLVVCNAVLEHIPGSVEAVASEIRRVGSRYFVAVPYRYSITEAHYHLPFTGFLPSKQRDWFVSRVLRRALHNDPIHLLTKGQMRQYFPDARVFLLFAGFGLFSSVLAVK